MVDEHIIELVYVGEVPADGIDHARTELVRVLGNRQEVTGWLIDTASTSNIEIAPNRSMYDVLGLWRVHGGRRFAVVTKASALKMVGSALRFAKVVPVQIFESRDAALAYLRQK